MKVTVQNRCPVTDGYRSERVRSLFNVDAVKGASFDLEVDVPVEGDWQIGVVVGPSGSGKTSIGRELQQTGFRWWDSGLAWSEDSLIEALPGPFDHVTGILSQVGLGSVPSWLRPYHVLSNGEQFRASLAALCLSGQGKDWVIDEFTSVLDRTVATVGSGAFAKTWRRGEGRVVLLTPHHDVVEWLQPDWVVDTGTGETTTEVGPRPKVRVEVVETGWSYWKSKFEPHHYLDAPPMPFGQAYVAFVGDEPVAHLGFSTMWSGNRVEARACRMVVLPEWQGAGVGMRFLNAMCERELRGEGWAKRPTTTVFHTAHPGLVAALSRDPRWRKVSSKLHGGRGSTTHERMKYGGHWRAVSGWRYYGQKGVEARARQTQVPTPA